MEDLKGYMRENGIKIQREIKDGVYHSILTIQGKEVGTMETVIDETATVVPRSTRSAEQTEVPAISVKWISITGLKGKGLGSILLLHELISICKHHPDIEWAVLDDDSDGSQNEENIYAQFGFGFCDQCSLTKKGRVKSSGPEKQLNLKKVNLEKKVNSLLKKLEKKAKSTGSGGGTKAKSAGSGGGTKASDDSDSDVSLGGKVRRKTKNKKQKRKKYTLRR